LRGCRLGAKTKVDPSADAAAAGWPGSTTGTSCAIPVGLGAVVGRPSTVELPAGNCRQARRQNEHASGPLCRLPLFNRRLPPTTERRSYAPVTELSGARTVARLASQASSIGEATPARRRLALSAATSRNIGRLLRCEQRRTCGGTWQTKEVWVTDSTRRGRRRRRGTRRAARRRWWWSCCESRGDVGAWVAAGTVTLAKLPVAGDGHAGKPRDVGTDTGRRWRPVPVPLRRVLPGTA